MLKRRMWMFEGLLRRCGRGFGKSLLDVWVGGLEGTLWVWMVVKRWPGFVRLRNMLRSKSDLWSVQT